MCSSSAIRGRPRPQAWPLHQGPALGELTREPGARPGGTGDTKGPEPTPPLPTTVGPSPLLYTMLAPAPPLHSARWALRGPERTVTTRQDCRPAGGAARGPGRERSPGPGAPPLPPLRDGTVLMINEGRWRTEPPPCLLPPQKPELLITKGSMLHSRKKIK